MASSLILRRSTSHFNKAIIRAIELGLLIDLVCANITLKDEWCFKPTKRPQFTHRTVRSGRK